MPYVAFNLDVRSFGGSKFGPGIGPIYFRDIDCTGTENSLAYCIANTNVDLCDHSDDAGLRCDGNISRWTNDTYMICYPNYHYCLDTKGYLFCLL